MKKINALVLLTTIIVAMTAASCSSCGSKQIDSASIDSDSETGTPETEEGTYAVLTDRGIAPVKCGMLVTDLRPSVPQLYDSIAISNGYESTVYKFIYEDRDRFYGYEFGDGTISLVAAADHDVVVETPSEDLTFGTPFSKVLALKEVTPQFQSSDDGGIWSWLWQGIYFIPSQDNLPHRLSSKLYTPGTPPTAEDFDDSVTIDYMGTGLPY